MAVATIPRCRLPKFLQAQLRTCARMSAHMGEHAMERLLHQKFAGFSSGFEFPNGGQPGGPPVLQQHCSKPAASQIPSSFNSLVLPL